ncbi:MAG: protein kinase [Actinomycetota bacterium]
MVDDAADPNDAETPPMTAPEHAETNVLAPTDSAPDTGATNVFPPTDSAPGTGATNVLAATAVQPDPDAPATVAQPHHEVLQPNPQASEAVTDVPPAETDNDAAMHWGDAADQTMRLDVAIINATPSLPSRFGRYEVVSRIGVGGFASVYAARDPELDTMVAVKVLAENHSANALVRRRFVAEARVARRLGHERLVGVFDLGEADNGCPYVVMELCERGSLRQRIVATGRPDVDDLIRLIEELATCMRSVHEQRVVHRDIKPSNLLFRATQGAPGAEFAPTRLIHDDERLILADFGMARDISGGVSSLTVGGGTEGYMAPEQATSDGKADTRADIYSATVVLAEFATGRSPERLDLATADISTAVLAALTRGVALDREERPATASHWRDLMLHAFREPGAVGGSAPDARLPGASGSPDEPAGNAVDPNATTAYRPGTELAAADAEHRPTAVQRPHGPATEVQADSPVPPTAIQPEAAKPDRAAPTPARPAAAASATPTPPPDLARPEPLAPPSQPQRPVRSPHRAAASPRHEPAATPPAASADARRADRPTPRLAQSPAQAQPTPRQAQSPAQAQPIPPAQTQPRPAAQTHPPAQAQPRPAAGAGAPLGAPPNPSERVETGRQAVPTQPPPPGHGQSDRGQRAARRNRRQPAPSTRTPTPAPPASRQAPTAAPPGTTQARPLRQPTSAPPNSAPVPASIAPEVAEARSREHMKTAKRLAKMEQREARKLARKARRRRRRLKTANFFLALIRGILAAVVAWITAFIFLALNSNQAIATFEPAPAGQLFIVVVSGLSFIWGTAYFPFPRSYDI